MCGEDRELVGDPSLCVLGEEGLEDDAGRSLYNGSSVFVDRVAEAVILFYYSTSKLNAGPGSHSLNKVR